MSYPEPPEPAGKPMVWRGQPPTTPGAAAVSLRKARLRVENVVHALNLARTDETVGRNDYSKLYRDLSDAALNLLAAEAAWERLSSRPDAITKSDVELVQ
jgi:hypothetical protein